VAISNVLPRTTLLQNWVDLVYTVRAGVDKFSRKNLAANSKFYARRRVRGQVSF
jgi:hypothetical protein